MPHQRARRLVGDVRIVLRDGGNITVLLDKLDKKRLTTRSENFGQTTMRLEAFRQIEFNIYEEKLNFNASDF